MRAPTIPATLKKADLTRFINKAAQLESINPVIAYWCEYWVVNNIIAKSLHNGDQATLDFTKVLMDKLELIKTENPDIDAISDDVAGQTYVEQFAMEIFQRAENALKAKKATKQTADTFCAAATFLELINIWTSPEPEIKAKIKYAKWNAVRINRALNEGKDPNEPNSNAETDSLKNFPKFSNETDAQESEEIMTKSSTPPITFYKELVEPCDDFTINVPLSPAQSPPTLTRVGVLKKPNLKRTTCEPEIEPPPPQTGHAKQNNPIKPKHNTPDFPVIQAELPILRVVPSESYSNIELSQPTIELSSKSNFNLESFPPPRLTIADSAVSEEICCETPLQAYKPQPQTLSKSISAPSDEETIILAANHHEVMPQIESKIDDLDIGNAQKHARWAISALNFEDTETAIKELREALRILHAE